jgi:hypothetical protein
MNLSVQVQLVFLAAAIHYVLFYISRRRQGRPLNGEQIATFVALYCVAGFLAAILVPVFMSARIAAERAHQRVGGPIGAAARASERAEELPTPTY